MNLRDFCLHATTLIYESVTLPGQQRVAIVIVIYSHSYCQFQLLEQFQF